jgi:predicted nucleotidyltransferase
MDSWYNKCFPLVKEIKPYLSKLASEIKSISGVKKVYVWGSYAENKDNPNFKLRDIDIIASTNFNSGDLISINNDIVSEGYLDNYLEEQGYDLKSIKFSQTFTKFDENNIDPWAISSDKKLLHWGPIFNNLQESNDIHKEAEKQALLVTGYNRYKTKKVSEKIKENWYEIYYSHINQYLQNMPSGWYSADIDNIKTIIQKSIEI